VGGNLLAIAEVLPFMLLIGCMLGRIYAGIATPIEAASIGCVVVLIPALLLGQFTWRILGDSLHRIVVVVGNIMFIVYTAFLVS
jgi:TRAP-type mannitol/chloroaromatic compound transport system permease large subunit